MTNVMSKVMSIAIERAIQKLERVVHNPPVITRTVQAYLDFHDSKGRLNFDTIVSLTKSAQQQAGDDWQDWIAEKLGCEPLRGDESKLDMKHDVRKFALELKSSWNTDNGSSKTANYDKLARFKKKNPEYDVIYGVLHAKQGKSSRRDIVHDGETILVLIGDELTQFLFEKTFQEVEIEYISDFLKKTKVG